MTTLSIIVGLIPVAIGVGVGSEQRASIAVTIIGGQTLCLLLTLLVVRSPIPTLRSLRPSRGPTGQVASWAVPAAQPARQTTIDERTLRD